MTYRYKHYSRFHITNDKIQKIVQQHLEGVERKKKLLTKKSFNYEAKMKAYFSEKQKNLSLADPHFKICEKMFLRQKENGTKGYLYLHKGM